MESINVVVDNNLKEYVKKDLYNIIEIIEENSLKKMKNTRKALHVSHCAAQTQPAFP